MTVIEFMDIYASIAAVVASGVTAFIVYQWKNRQLEKAKTALLMTQVRLGRMQLEEYMKATEGKQ